mmetsp:Transcript_11225/g.33693  ORF Transcript_11225/g.33693 Transcript_11225/m.33693 type:complete len:334 (+) Transcript_11225:1692-2693(+)
MPRDHISAGRPKERASTSGAMNAGVPVILVSTTPSGASELQPKSTPLSQPPAYGTHRLLAVESAEGREQAEPVVTAPSAAPAANARSTGRRSAACVTDDIPAASISASSMTRSRWAARCTDRGAPAGGSGTGHRGLPGASRKLEGLTSPCRMPAAWQARSRRSTSNTTIAACLSASAPHVLRRVSMSPPWQTSITRYTCLALSNAPSKAMALAQPSNARSVSISRRSRFSNFCRLIRPVPRLVCRPRGRSLRSFLTATSRPVRVHVARCTLPKLPTPSSSLPTWNRCSKSVGSPSSVPHAVVAPAERDCGGGTGSAAPEGVASLVRHWTPTET